MSCVLGDFLFLISQRWKCDGQPISGSRGKTRREMETSSRGLLFLLFPTRWGDRKGEKEGEKTKRPFSSQAGTWKRIFFSKMDKSG